MMFLKCRCEESFSDERKLRKHLFLFHSEMSRDEQVLLVKKAKLCAISPISPKAVAAIEADSTNESSKKVNLFNLKREVLKVLYKANARAKLIDNVIFSHNFKDLKKIISGTSRDIKKRLRKAGILIDETKSTKIKRPKIIPAKSNQKKSNEYFDQTLNSIKPIYTPMGNKR